MKHPILIKFGDNDFGRTFVPLLEAFAESEFDGTKEELIALINECLPAFYRLYQNPFRYRENAQDIRNYLQVGEREVYYGAEEVDIFFKDPELMGRCDSDCYFIYPAQLYPSVGIL